MGHCFVPPVIFLWPLMTLSAIVMDGGCGGAMVGGCLVETVKVKTRKHILWKHMGVSENSGTPKSSILMSLSIINHPCWGTPIFGNTHIIFRTWNTIRGIPSTSFHFRKKSLSTFDFSMDFFSPFKSQTNGGLNRFPKISVHSSPHAAAVCLYSTHLNTTAGWDHWKGIECTLHFTAR